MRRSNLYAQWQPMNLNNPNKKEREIYEKVLKPYYDKNPREIGGRKDGLEPTRYNDWEMKGRCIDF